MINSYGHFLQSKKLLLWTVRLGLLAIVFVHIVVASQLTALNRAARPTQYATKPGWGSTWQSRYMMVSGLVIAAFVIYHLAHFTALLPGVNGIGHDFSKLRTVVHGEEAHDVYGMMILGFQVWWVSLFYIVAQGLLFIHLYHGLASMLQTVGFRGHALWPPVQRIMRGISIAIFIGYAIIPIAIYFRVVGNDYAERKKAEMISAGLVQSAAPVGKEAAK
jgi:succinate dehydrogenase / fumarate reductase cytochrome b subunit